jgi:hypothetical protein
MLGTVPFFHFSVVKLELPGSEPMAGRKNDLPSLVAGRGNEKAAEPQIGLEKVLESELNLETKGSGRDLVALHAHIVATGGSEKEKPYFPARFVAKDCAAGLGRYPVLSMIFRILCLVSSFIEG